MRRSMTIIISSIVIMMMANACAPRNDGSESVFRERLVNHYVEDDTAARALNGEPLRLDIRFVHLDGDGKPEAIVRLDHPAFCGSRGCAIDVVRFESDRIVVLGAFIAHEAVSGNDIGMSAPSLRIGGERWSLRGRFFRRVLPETD